MQKQKIVIIIGVVLALAGVILINAYVQQREEEIKRQAKKAMAKIQTNQTAVLTARKDISRGATIEADMLETSIVPNQYLQPQAVTSLDSIAGMLVSADISKGEQISLNKLSRQEEPFRSSLSSATPAGKRAITISVDNVASLVGMINPGDYVDVITAIPVPVTAPDGKQDSQMAVLPLFQNVLVLAIGQNLSKFSTAASAAEGRYEKAIKKEASPYVTLALNPEEANLLAFVQEQGKLRLTLRSPIDSNVGPVQPASWETVFQYIMPKKEFVKEETKKEEEVISGETIEIYRGLTKEQIPISKG